VSEAPTAQHSELTVRAVAAGLLVGCLIGASNVCIGLKIGWTFGASITAAVISFAMFRALGGLLNRPYTAGENLISATAGSSSGTMASAAGLVSCIPALAMLGTDLSYWQLVGWAISVAFLGVFFAVPLRRQMVVVERLRYPTGTAAAETIKAMYASGAEALAKAKVLLYAGLAAGGIKLVLSVKPLGLHAFENLSLDDVGLASVAILGVGVATLKLGMNLSPMMLGAGILIGPRVGWSLFAGSVIAWGICAPLLIHLGVVHPHTPAKAYHAAFKWVLWPGVAIMVFSGFTSLALQWRTVLRAFGIRVGDAGSGDGEEEEETVEDAPQPVPTSFLIVGLAAAALLTTLLAWTLFDIKPWMGLLAVVMSFFIAMIAVRATGETDINPVGAMGKITQVVYGALDPGRMSTNLMAAGITAAGASQAGDLMHDLKAGFLLKVSIFKQVVTQLIGVCVGVFAVVGVYKLLAEAYEIPGDEFTGPAVQAWYAMAQVLVKGLSSLPPGAVIAAGVGAVAGVALTLLARIKGVARFLPSPVALGIAFMVPAYYSWGMWIGALITWWVNKRQPDKVERFGASLASGLIAGEGIMMVLVAVLLIIGVSWV